ncbi:BTAD domain-containing putative transcriptional regulator [Streptosporangium sp. NPDC051022]|uniref:AfsR/SARP family transcriptional regulator n=1 Tax=Streptosporangium sp. NPDC051022 TaxID=3155752 RepID=UPI00344ABACF
MLEVSLLGPVRVSRDGVEVDPGAPMQRLLVAVLALAGGRAVGRDALIDALWGQWPPRTALNVLRTYVSRVRAVLGAGAVPAVGDGYALSGFTTDLAAFERLTGQERYGEALRLWRGEALAGVGGDYAGAQRGLLEERRLSVLERRIERDLDEGRHAEALGELSALSEAHPLRERLRGALMTALYRSGRQAEALAAFARTRALLADELGVDPSRELAELHVRMLRADPALSGPASSESALSDPASFDPPLSGRPPPGTAVSGPAGVVRPAQLPADVADFTGRAAQVRELTAALARGRAPAVVAVAGIGGVGKTTLAVRAAHGVRERFPDGQLAIDLRGASAEPVDPAVALERFLRALGAGRIPEEPEERAALYRSLLADRRILVLLDNAATAAQVRPLLPGTPGCAVIVTGRARLAGLPTSRTLDLGVPERAEALGLLAAVAGEERVAAEPEAAARVVAFCGRLPLAVRIAASRLAARPGWSLAVLGDRLADERRRLSELTVGDLAVEATFALGHDQLSAEQSRAFRLLALADAPEITLRTAAVVLDTPEPERLCESLVDLAMLESASPGVYRYHDLLRVYGAAKAEPGERVRALARLMGDWLNSVRNAAAVLDGLPRRLTPGRDFTEPRAAADWLAEEAACMVATLRAHEGEPGPLDPTGSTLAVARALRGAGGDGEPYDVLTRGLLALGRGGPEPGVRAALRALRA